PPQLGVVSLHAQARARIAGGIRDCGAQPAVPRTGGRIGQCRPLLAGAGRRGHCGELFSSRAWRPARQSLGQPRDGADRVQGWSLRPSAHVDERRDAHDQPATRRAAPRHVCRAQAGRSPGRAVVCLAVAQPLSGRAGDESDCHRKLRVTATETGVDASPQGPPAGQDGPGSRLKSAREAAGLSLDQVAQQLKLAPRQVRALEDEDFAQLPGRTFARGFVRNYARLLNLEADDLLALMPDAAHAPALGSPALHSTSTTMGELPTATVTRPNFMRWLIPLVLVASIVGAAAYEWYRGGLVAPGDVSHTVASAPQVDPQLPAPPATPPAPATGTSSTLLPNPLAAEGQAIEPSPVPETRD